MGYIRNEWEVYGFYSFGFSWKRITIRDIALPFWINQVYLKKNNLIWVMEDKNRSTRINKVAVSILAV